MPVDGKYDLHPKQGKLGWCGGSWDKEMGRLAEGKPTITGTHRPANLHLWNTEAVTTLFTSSRRSSSSSCLYFYSVVIIFPINA